MSHLWAAATGWRSSATQVTGSNAVDQLHAALGGRPCRRGYEQYSYLAMFAFFYLVTNIKNGNLVRGRPRATSAPATSGTAVC